MLNRISLIALLAALSSCTNGPQATSGSGSEASQTPDTSLISIGDRVHLRSEVLDREMEAYVHLPWGYDKSQDHVPVIYVLDAEEHFQFAVAASDLLASTGNMPKSIVVGILTADRNRDLTTPPGPGFDYDHSYMTTSGGSADFLAYLEKELLPFIEQRYRTQPHRTLIGHSLGGHFVADAAAHAPYLFNNYILLDPSLWWNNGEVLDGLGAMIAKRPEPDLRFYWYRDNCPHDMWFPATQRWSDLLDTMQVAGWHANRREEVGEKHGTIPLPGIYFGLKDLFADYPMPETTERSLGSFIAHYADLSKKYGYTVPVPEPMLDELHTHYVTEKLEAEALAVDSFRHAQRSGSAGTP